MNLINETCTQVYAAREAAEARAIEEAAAREMEASARRTAEEKLAALEARLRTLERGGPHRVTGATIVTSNLDFSEWGDAFPNRLLGAG